jgi:DNA-binding beta-propeller fold protein YncE
VNGTSGTLVTTVSLPSAYYSTMTLNPETDVLYVSGERMLAALNGTNGQETFEAGYADPQTCGPFLYMAADPSSNQVLMVPQNYDNYLLVYDGTSGALVDMYSFTGSLGPVAFDADTGEIYAATSAGLFAFRSSTVSGGVNSTLIGSYLNCLPV